MSIEGKALERDPKNEKHITKAIINNIALTFTPVNFNSYIDFVKGIQSQDFIPTGDLLKSQLKRDVMFEQVIGNKRIVLDSKFRIIQEGIWWLILGKRNFVIFLIRKIKVVWYN